MIINYSERSKLINEYPTVIKKIKQVFFHKISLFLKNGTDNLLIYALINLKSVALFGNYFLIFSKLNSLIMMAFAGTGSAVGNLIAEDDKENIKKVFWELVAIQFFIAGFFSLVMYHIMDKLILFWLGDSYVLSKVVLILFISNFFMMQITATIDRFKNAYGLYSDVWAAVLEAIINLIVSVTLGSLYGIPGIIAGTVCSLFIIGVLWKPYYLFNHGFNKSVFIYWKGLLPLIIIFLCASLCVYLIINYILIINEDLNIIYFIFYSTKVCLLVLFVYGLPLYICVKSFKSFIDRVIQLILNKFNK